MFVIVGLLGLVAEDSTASDVAAKPEPEVGLLPIIVGLEEEELEAVGVGARLGGEELEAVGVGAGPASPAVGATDTDVVNCTGEGAT